MIELITPHLLDWASYSFTALFNIRLGIVLQGLYYKALRGEKPTIWDKIASLDFIPHTLFILTFIYQIPNMPSVFINSELWALDVLVAIANFQQPIYLRLCKLFVRGD